MFRWDSLAHEFRFFIMMQVSVQAKTKRLAIDYQKYIDFVVVRPFRNVNLGPFNTSFWLDRKDISACGKFIVLLLLGREIAIELTGDMKCGAICSHYFESRYRYRFEIRT
jgi:hypothetical protein